MQTKSPNHGADKRKGCFPRVRYITSTRIQNRTGRNAIIFFPFFEKKKELAMNALWPQIHQGSHCQLLAKTFTRFSCTLVPITTRQEHQRRCYQSRVGGRADRRPAIPKCKSTATIITNTHKKSMRVPFVIILSNTSTFR